MRLIAKNTVEEGMLAIARSKLRLEQDVTNMNGECPRFGLKCIFSGMLRLSKMKNTKTLQFTCLVKLEGWCNFLSLAAACAIISVMYFVNRGLGRSASGRGDAFT